MGQNQCHSTRIKKSYFYHNFHLSPKKVVKLSVRTSLSLGLNNYLIRSFILFDIFIFNNSCAFFHTSCMQSWYFGPFCRRKSTKWTFRQKWSVFGPFLPQKVLFHSWYMYVWHTIGIVISRAFSLNIEYNFHKIEILFDSKFSLEYISHQMLCNRHTSWLTTPIPTTSTRLHWCPLKFYWFNFFYLHLCSALKYDC